MYIFKTRFFLFTTLLVLVLAWSFPAFSQDKATKAECIEKCMEAAKMIKEIGLEPTLAKINDKNGPFVWKDSYVFCIEDGSAKFLASPVIPKRMIGLSVKDYMDPDGKKIFMEFMKMANDEGAGWVSYKHERNPSQPPKAKTSYVYKVPDTNVIVGAGIYE